MRFQKRTNDNLNNKYLGGYFFLTNDLGGVAEVRATSTQNIFISESAIRHIGGV